MLKTIILIVLSITLLPLYAQVDEFRFQRISLEDGLSQGRIHCIVRDHKGYMWFGTQDGLNQYNGYDFIIHRKDASKEGSISSKHINTIFEDKFGYLWIGTNSGELNCYNHKTEKFDHFLYDSINENRSVSAIFESDSNLWIGTYGNTIANFDRRKKVFNNVFVFESEPGIRTENKIVGINRGSTDTLIIATTKHLYFYCETTQRFEKIDYNNDQKPSDEFLIKQIITLGEELWICTNNGLYRFNLATKEKKHFNYNSNENGCISSNQVNCIQTDALKRIWVGTSKGLNLYDETTQKFSSYFYEPENPKSISENNIYCLYGDQDGTLWAGTNNSGVCFTSEYYKKFHTVRENTKLLDGLQDNIVRCFFEDTLIDGKPVWIGTNSKGVSLYDYNTRKFISINRFSPIGSILGNKRVNSILRTHDKVLWFGTDNGLYKYSSFYNKIERFIHIPGDSSSIINNNINILFEDNYNNLWIGTEGGLSKYDQIKNVFKNYYVLQSELNINFNNDIRAIEEDHQGFFWIGTLNGLYILNRQTEKFKHITYKPDSDSDLSSNRILQIFEDSQQKLWIATVDGLNLFLPEQKKFKRYTSKDGLPNNVIYATKETDGGILWISTNGGISRFDSQKEEFFNFNSSDGLQGNEFNYGASLKSSSGIIFFGGVKGFTYFNPSEIKSNPVIPPLVFTNFRILNQPVPIGDTVNGNIILSKSIDETEEIVLSHKDYIITFEYAALNYFSPEKNQYAYMLEGLEKSWNFVGNQRSVSYSTLPAGEYTFMIKAANNDGIWNEAGRKIKVIVLPPWWETKLFYFILFVSISLLIATGVRLRIKNLKKAKTILEKTVKDRTFDLQEVNTLLEEKQAELEIRQEEITAQAEYLEETNKELEKLSLVARETDNAVTIINENGQIEWVNAGFTRLYGQTLESIKKDNTDNIFAFSQNKDTEEIFKNCISSRKAKTYLTQVTLKNNKTKWIQTTLTPIFNIYSEINKFIAIDSDITKLKLAEQEIMQQRDQLAQLNQTKDKFFKIIAHDLRNPFGIIMGFAELILKQIEAGNKEKSLAYSKIMYQSTQIVHQLLENLLTWSRSQSNQIEYKPNNYDLKEIADYTISLFNANAEMKKIELKSSLDQSVFVFVDHNMILTVLRNLVSNALKFSNPECSITISSSIKDKMAIVSVVDTGIGMSEEVMSKLFQIDQNIKTSGTANEPGTGLGLILCKEFVEQNGGNISVSSQQGRGSRFEFSIPLAKKL